MEILLPILALVVLVTGLVVVVVSRRRSEDAGIDVPTAADRLQPPPEGPLSPPPELAREDADVPLAADPSTAQAVPGTDDGQAEQAEAAPEPEAAEPDAERPTFRDRLAKARATFSGYVSSMLSRSDIDQETWDELEEALIRADVGVQTTTVLLDELRSRVEELGITDPHELLEAFKAQLKEKLGAGDRTLHLDGSSGTDVWLFVGVNGVGKTTSIGKVGKRQADEGRSVLMAAGDTFRAAAAEQLQTWAERAGADYHRAEEGSDPSSVVFDAIAKAASRDIDLVLADTAGRLHTKTNLMDELAKVRRVADREPGHVTEVLLVIDATTGQNGLQQARQFSEATQCTGVVLTKLDGSAKGGIAMAIALDLGLPIKLVGLGESVEDLVDFDPDAFVDALFEIG